MRLLLYVEGMPLDTLRAGIAWAWEDFAGYLDALERRGIGPNVAAFVGHSAVRYHVMGAAAVERAATPRSARRWPPSSARRWLPGPSAGRRRCRRPTSSATARRRRAGWPTRRSCWRSRPRSRDLDRGVIEVAPRTLLGPTDDKAAEQQFFAELARASGKVVSWAPLLDSPFAPGSAERLIEDAAALQAAGAAVVPQVGCRPLEVRFDFATPAFFLENNPFWRPLMARPLAERRRLFADADFRTQLAGDGRGFVASVAPAWDRLLLRLPARRGDGGLAGPERRRDRRRARLPAASTRSAMRVLADDLAGAVGRRAAERRRAGGRRAAPASRRPAGPLRRRRARRHALRPGVHDARSSATGCASAACSRSRRPSAS